MAMQMLMMIVESHHREKIESALTEHRVLGYTEIPTVYGTGSTGPRLGSRAFPEQSSIIFTVIDEAKVQELLDAIDSSCSECRAGMRMIVWKVDRML
jgi:nitrogen regulatory protein PII